MLDLLYAAANNGTGRRAALGVPTFGKTGTTQDNRDALFVGFAGDLVVGVWVGRDDNRSLGKVSGGTVPAQIWRNFMASALAHRPAAAARRCRPNSGCPAPAASRPAQEPAAARMERRHQASCASSRKLVENWSTSIEIARRKLMSGTCAFKPFSTSLGLNSGSTYAEWSAQVEDSRPRFAIEETRDGQVSEADQE